MRLSRRAVFVLSGVSWFGIGIFLMSKGLKFVMQAVSVPELSRTMQTLCSIGGGRQEGALFLIVLALLVGFLKGRMALAKTVKRVADRVYALPEPIKLSQVYSRGYYALIGGMVILGLSFNVLGFASEWRGALDVAIGSALINGAALYLRQAAAAGKKAVIPK